MAYSLVEDRKSGKVCGLWLRNPQDAQNRELVCALLMKEGASRELGAMALAGSFRVVPNTFDSNGGCFIMFGSELAPGEDAEAKPRKKGWRFWRKH